MPDEDGATGVPLLNLCADRCLAARADRFDALKKKAAGSRNKYVEEDIERALLLGARCLVDAATPLRRHSSGGSQQAHPTW